MKNGFQKFALASKNVSELASPDLLSHTRDLVAQERKITLALIEHLAEINRRMLYLELGFGSLFEFAVKHLKLSEGSAHRRIAAMRLVQEIPEVREKLESGCLTLTNAAKIQVAFKAVKKTEILSVFNKGEIVEKCLGASQRECETTLLTILPALAESPAYTEKKRTIAADTVEVKLVISKTLQNKIEKLNLIESHSNPELSYLKLFARLVDQALSKHSAVGQIKTKRSENPRAISKNLRALVFQKAKHQCQFPECKSQYQLQIDHVKPVALGGTAAFENLRVLCGKHNRYEAEKMLG